MTTEAVVDERDTVDEFVKEVQRFVRQRIRGDVIDREGVIPEAVRRGAAELGLFGLTLPVSHGGAGLSLVGASRIVAEIARVDRSVAIMIGLHAGLGTRGLVEHGTPGLRAAWLPRLARGEEVASFAATETGAGSDLTAIRTTGTATAAGLRIDGEKSYVTNGGFAGLFTVLVRTPGLGGERAFSLVAVPRDTPGAEIGGEEDKLGIRGSSTVTVRFDGATVPFDHLLGDPGRGTELTHGLLAWGRTLMSAGCVGTARAALDATLAHVVSRRQFGRPIGAFGATQAHVAFMASRVAAIDAYVTHVGESLARGESVELSSAIAKVFASESAFQVCDRAVQLHGALGFLETTGVARMLRDCRITRIFEGANDVLRLRVGTARLASRDRERRVAGVAELDAVELRLSDAVTGVRARLGLAAMRRQLVLLAIADAVIAVEVARVLAPRVRVDALAAHAVEALVDEASHALDALARAERDGESAERVVRALYDVRD